MAIEHADILGQGFHEWHSWRRANPSIKPILCGVDLRGKYLAGLDLSSTNLFEANLSNASLRRTNLADATLNGTNLHGTDFYRADLSRADLAGANFTRASLINANFTGARLYGKFFAETDMRSALGLDSCIHRGPSFVDISTLANSSPLPLQFLRGCGLPENVITYLPSLLARPFEFYSCFISYSTKDQEFADRLHADLQNKGVRCWFAPHDIQGGKKIHEQIDEAIRVYQRLLLILSPASMNSEWVKTEISKARKREKQEDRRMLFPVRLVDYDALQEWECFDGDLGKDSAREIREYYVPDFSNWKDHDCYKKELEKLLRDLRAEGREVSVLR